MKSKVIDFLNKEWEKTKGKTSRIKGFYSKHSDLIDTAVYEGGISSAIVAGLNPDIVFGAGIAGLSALFTKWGFGEKKKYGGSFWQAGMKRKERLEDVI
jgi:hypothetical protein